jgi:hypothetical protein
MYTIQFIPNKDEKTTCMLVDNIPVEMEVPFAPYKGNTYIPHNTVDMRGVYLQTFCLNEGINWEELEFPDLNENEVKLVRTLFEYNS